ncbi:hypothetical protein FH972_001005 [Carpinus fangiana]|uniref:Uncharacterized protein n=1 Tax=Carpinus fangiana TaxID=176857 RepID=A0A5N6QCT1_9ROSI|nr:hypothetical protein FH972_001005 [Carpinus fangiana]
MEIGRQKLLLVAFVLLVVATFPAEARKLVAATDGDGHGKEKEVSFQPKPDLSVKRHDVKYGMLKEASNPPPAPEQNHP